MLREFAVLGCGTCINDGRLPSGYMLRFDSGLMLLDNGPGTLEKLPELGCSATAVRYVALTHAHPDHVCLGYLLQVQLNTPDFVRGEPLIVIGPREVMDYAEAVLRIWPSLRPRDFELRLFDIAEAGSFSGDDFDIYAFRVLHGRSAVGYRIVADNAIIAYSGDTGMPDDSTLVELGRNANLYLIECSYPPGLEARGHLNADQVASVLAEARPQVAVLTHLYPQAHEFGPDRLAEYVQQRSGCRVEIAQPLRRWQFA